MTLTRVLLLPVWVAGALAPLAAAAECPSPIGPSGQDIRLTNIWYEVEGEWHGTWTPLHQAFDGVYGGNWVKGSERTAADLQITITGTDVHVLRTQSLGTCNYNGNISRDLWHVSGLFSCTWHPQRLRWSARIGNGYPPMLRGPCG